MTTLKTILYAGPRYNASDTSRAAAQEALPYFASRKDQIETYLQGVDGDTRDGVALRLGIEIPSVCSAVNALLAEGRVVRTEERRLTRSKRKAEVLRVRQGQGALL